MWHDDKAISISEDTTCRIWSISERSSIACWGGHEGKGIWSVAISSEMNIVVIVFLKVCFKVFRRRVVLTMVLYCILFRTCIENKVLNEIDAYT